MRRKGLFRFHARSGHDVAAAEYRPGEGRADRPHHRQGRLDFGGSGGRAVLFVRDDQTGRWAGPAFYNIGAASVGFQAGVAKSETVTLVMTDEGVNSLLASSAKLGGDLSIAAGPCGAGTGADVTSDFVAYSRSKGVYGGVTLKGSVVGVADDWNRAYYGKSVLPPDILLDATAHNAQADRLAAALGRAAEPRRTQLRRIAGRHRVRPRIRAPSEFGFRSTDAAPLREAATSMARHCSADSAGARRCRRQATQRKEA